MTSRTLMYSAWASILLVILTWTGFGFFVYTLSDERSRYASLQQDSATREEREKSAGTLRTLLRDTREEREILEELARTDVLAAAATIESAGKIAGVDVFIEGAVSAAVPNVQSNELQAITVTANADGRFENLMRAAALFESLPFPATVESYDIRAIPTIGKAPVEWRMTTRIRIITISEGGV